MPATSNGQKWCPGCKTFKSPDVFNRNRSSIDGLYGYCKPCKQARDRRDAGIRRQADPVRAWARQCVASARRRADTAGVPFSMTVEDVVAAAVPICPALGIPLAYLTEEGTPGRKGPATSAPTVDRIVGSTGYVPGNIVVMSFKANRIKNDSTPAELEAVATFVSSLTPFLTQ